ncbi:MAG: DUF2769 domain-containing protein [Methanomassiliicoccales archaeon]
MQMTDVSKVGKYMEQCICPTCPSYNRCARFRSQKVFCVKGKSPTDCIKERKGCKCGECPVGKELGLLGEYFCIDGVPP